VTVWWIFGLSWFAFIGSRLPGRAASFRSRIVCATVVMLFMALLIATVRYEAGIRPGSYDPEPSKPAAGDDARQYAV